MKVRTVAAPVNQDTSQRVDLATLDIEEIITEIPGFDPHADTGGADFYPDEALKVIGFFQDCLTHVKGKLAGKPLILERWQMAIMANLFGWIGTDGLRRFQELLVYVPRKNGKTTIAAGIPLYVLFCDPEIGKEIYAAAADRQQASILFGIAKSMVLKEKHLEKRCKLYTNAIVRVKQNSFFKAISKDSRTKHGFNASVVIVDELHAQPDRELVDVLETSTGSREQPIFASITTADFDRPIEESICNEKLAYAQGVRDGLIPDSSFLPIVYETLIHEDWKDPAVWSKCNPNLGVSLMEGYFERKFRKALQARSFENTFKRLHLNQKTQQDVRYLAVEDWDACATKLQLEKLKGKRCYAGLDLASSEDITALVLVFPTEQFTVIPFFWIPRDTATDRQRRTAGKAKYLTWAQQGLIELTDGDRIDDDHIVKRICEIAKEYKIREFGIDPWNTRHIMAQLDARGFHVNEFYQGFASMNSPTKLLELLVHSRRLKHGGHPIMRWMAGNLAVQEDPTGHIRPAKKLSTEKVDGMVALIMAIATASLFYNRRSVYSDRGFQSL